MKDELGGKITIKFVGPRAKTYSCLIDDDKQDKKNKKKGAEKCVIKRNLTFENYKIYLEATNLMKK